MADIDPAERRGIERAEAWLREHSEAETADAMRAALITDAPTLRDAAEALFAFPVGCLVWSAIVATLRDAHADRTATHVSVAIDGIRSALAAEQTDPRDARIAELEAERAQAVAKLAALVEPLLLPRPSALAELARAVGEWLAYIGRIHGSVDKWLRDRHLH